MKSKKPTVEKFREFGVAERIFLTDVGREFSRALKQFPGAENTDLDRLALISKKLGKLYEAQINGKVDKTALEAIQTAAMVMRYALKM